MPPRHQTLPSAQTASARAAMQSFYCELCSKGYTRMNDYEAHLGSYDHSHRQRMKDMKQMVKDPTAGARARKAEAKADGLITIKFGNDAAGSAPNAGGNSAAPGSGAGFKKGGFKKSGFKSAFAPAGGEEDEGEDGKADEVAVTIKKPTLDDDTVESDTDDEGYEVYDPRKPTD
ncbi:pre-60S factor REI1 [Microdochium nivale]|nr:pre-60S factor REI1 [Microdochium nivale]